MHFFHFQIIYRFRGGVTVYAYKQIQLCMSSWITQKAFTWILYMIVPLTQYTFARVFPYPSDLNGSAIYAKS